MKIAVASASAVKLEACRKAFGAVAPQGGVVDIIPVKAPSGVAEQPVGDETLTGALNRISHARSAVHDADYYVSIENGLFVEDGRYIDRAVVVIARRNEAPQTFYSDGVEFPSQSVEETRKRGFDTWTVGKVMAEQGVVSQHDDPHLSLSGKSRVAYINETAARAVSALKPR